MIHVLRERLRLTPGIELKRV